MRKNNRKQTFSSISASVIFHVSCFMSLLSSRYSHKNKKSVAIDSSHIMFLNACVLYDLVRFGFFLFL